MQRHEWLKKGKCVCKCHFQRHPQSETITDATDMKTVASHLHRTKSWRHPGPWSWRLTKAGKRRVCNNFRHRFFVFINSSACYSNAPRMGTEGTGPQTVQENGPDESGLFPTVLRRKNKNLGLSSGKFRGLAPKVRMFCLKKSDVFMSIFCCFHPFFGLSRIKFRDFHHKNSNWHTSTTVIYNKNHHQTDVLARKILSKYLKVINFYLHSSRVDWRPKQ